MQSQHSSKKQKPKALSLPWGHGSMALHGTKWWIVWRDVAGKVHNDNSGTADAQEAQKMLAERALPRAQAMLDTLRRIADGEETYQGDSPARRKSAQPRKVGRDRGKAAANPRPSGGQGQARGEA
jgi:hypothetical protein